MNQTITPLDRYRGGLLGLAVGNDLGVAWSERPVRETWEDTSLFPPAGHSTDDTSLALCLAESLLAAGGFNPLDQMTRYLCWYRTRYPQTDGSGSVDGPKLDEASGRPAGTAGFSAIDAACRSALERFERTGEPFSGSLRASASAGGGSLARLAAVPLFYAERPAEAVIRAGDSSLTTHAGVIGVDACRYFAALLLGALAGEAKEALLSGRRSPADGFWEKRPLVPEIARIAGGAFLQPEPPELAESDNAARILTAALWAFARGSTFRECLELAVSLGPQAEKVGAVCGQLAGIYYGATSIPEPWLNRLADRKPIEETAEALYRERLTPQAERPAAFGPVFRFGMDDAGQA